MKEFPLDPLIDQYTSEGKDPKGIYTVLSEFGDLLYFSATLKQNLKNLEEFQFLIFNIFKPSLDRHTSSLRKKEGFKLSRHLLDENQKGITVKSDYNRFKNETIILAYVALYHNLETSEKELLLRLNTVLKTTYKDLAEINFRNKKKALFSSRDRLRVLANCIKHNRRMAIQELCEYYPNLKVDELIRFNFRDLKKDIKEVKIYYHYIHMYLISFAGKEQVKILKTDLDTEGNPELEKNISDMETAFKGILEFFGKTSYSV